MNWAAGLAGGAALGGIPLLTSAAESLVNAKMTHDTNKSNESMARDANIASAKQANDQMEFQREMSNTAYQRGMADMKKAGLNPILASSQGGASTPSGAQGTVAASKNIAPQISGITNSATSAINTALQMRRDDSSIALQDEQKVQTAANTQKTLADAEKTKVQTAIDLAHEKRMAQIYHDTASARQLNRIQADWDISYFEWNQRNKQIQDGAKTVEGVGDAFYSLLPGGKFIKNLTSRGANSAKDYETSRERSERLLPKGARKDTPWHYKDKNDKINYRTGEW